MYHVRWMVATDFPAVLEIERGSYSGKWVWTEEDFRCCLRQRNCIAMVAESPESPESPESFRVVGYVLYELHPDRIELLNLAADPLRRRERVGTALIDKMKYKVCAHRRTRITALTRDSNTPAQLFFRACGFAACEVLRGHYEDGGEDAYRFTWRPTRAERERAGYPVPTATPISEHEFGDEVGD